MLIRQAREADALAIEALLAAVQMAGEVEPGAYLVAEEDEWIVGAGRLEWEGGEPYLRSIAVWPDWQGRGVGRALVDRLIAGERIVKVVSRGEAAPFYRRLGFKTAEWADIDARYRAECDACPDHAQCRPQPFVRRSAESPDRLM